MGKCHLLTSSNTLGGLGVKPPSPEEEAKPDDETTASRVSAQFENRPLPLGFVGLVSLDDPPDQRMAHNVLRGEVVEADAPHALQDALRLGQA
jgi:hypothetical protein